MKRTKEAYYRENPTFEQTQLSSGVTFVIGEDSSYYDRTRENQKLQKQFLDEQVEQKKMIKESQKQTFQQFDQQLLQNTHQRGQLEMMKKERTFQVEKAHDLYNLNLANEKKEMERQQREREIEQQKRQLELLRQRKVKRVGI